MNVKNYKNLFKNNTISLYQKADDLVLKNFNVEAKLIAKKFKLDDRIESDSLRDTFITFQDDKETFSNYPKCRLINPAKPEIGKISNGFLDINSSLWKITFLINGLKLKLYLHVCSSTPHQTNKTVSFLNLT